MLFCSCIHTHWDFYARMPRFWICNTSSESLRWLAWARDVLSLRNEIREVCLLFCVPKKVVLGFVRTLLPTENYFCEILQSIGN